MATNTKKKGGDGDPKRMRGEFRSGPIAGTAVISGATFFGKEVHYADVEGLAIFEGDIVLGSVNDMMSAAAADAAAFAEADAGSPIMQPQFSIGITGQQFRWPNATIPFEIDPALPNSQRVRDAIAHWESNTRIRFTQRTTANAAQFPDFVRFVPGGGCSSMVGRQTRQQNITLAPECSSGNAIHEIGHSVGLWHEQSREDRNTFVRIVFANIDPSMQHNFLQHIADGDDLGAYDYDSIMHYPTTAFSINGQATIVALRPIPPGVVLGQRGRLSQGDIDGVHQMYPAPTITVKETAKDPISDTIKEVRKDPIADPTIKEVRKDPITDPTIKEARKDPIADPTLKEVRKDPIADPTRKEAAFDTLFEGIGPGPVISGNPAPFVIASPSRAPAADQQQANDIGAQMEAIAQAIEAIEQQHAELVAAYDAAAQSLNSQG